MLGIADQSWGKLICVSVSNGRKTRVEPMTSVIPVHAMLAVEPSAE